MSGADRRRDAPDRDPELLQWLYDFAFLSFSGTMGVFLIGSLLWMAAILIDHNRVFPKWFGYLNLCNALTEVVVAPAWIFHRGVFAWNGLICWWINIVVFGVYTGAFIVLLRQMIRREDFGAAGVARPGAGRVTGLQVGRRHRRPVAHVPGQPDMWAFVLFETLIFTGYFRRLPAAAHRGGRRPSWTRRPTGPAHRGVQHHRVAAQLVVGGAVASSRHARGAYGSAHRDALLTVLFGVVFAVSKVSEWIGQLGRGNGVAGNEFFTFYYFLTGIHFLHLLIGFVVPAIVGYQIRGPARRSQNLIETGATYWHTVDFLWVLIFALLYVVR